MFAGRLKYQTEVYHVVSGSLLRQKRPGQLAQGLRTTGRGEGKQQNIAISRTLRSKQDSMSAFYILSN